MRKNLIFALFAVLLVAGCTGGGDGVTTGTGDFKGLSITEFSLNPSEARGNQAVTVKMTVQNNGQKEVRDSDYFAVLISPSDWRLLSAATTDTTTTTSSRTTTSTTTTLLPPNVKTYSNPLRPSIGEQKAVPHTFTWTIYAPPSQGADTPYDFTGRIYYKYVTNATGTVSVYPDSELENAKEKAEFSSSSGPVEIAIEVNPNPPVIYAETGDEFTLTIHVKNRGEGVIYQAGSVSANDYNIDPQTELGRLTLIGTLPSGLTWSDPSCLGSIQFFGSSKEEIATCAVKVIQKPKAKTPYRISIGAEYGYYEESKGRVVLKAR